MHKIFVFLIFLSLTGCGSMMMGGTSGLAQINGLSVMGTDKTLLDHVISVSSGKNCSSVQLEKGDYFCEEDEPQVKQNIYCYKTLASVTCYDRPDPYKGDYQKVGVNDHNLIDKKSQNSR